jgi:hypothetical protein
MNFAVLSKALKHSQHAGLAIHDYGHSGYQVSQFFIVKPLPSTRKALFKIVD